MSIQFHANLDFVKMLRPYGALSQLFNENSIEEENFMLGQTCKWDHLELFVYWFLILPHVIVNESSVGTGDGNCGPPSITAFISS